LINVIALSIYTIVVGVLTTRLFILYKRNDVLQSLLVQSYIEKKIYIDKLAEEIQKRENTNVESTEGFLNFVSTSRDWAYEYIENVQAELTRVFSVIDSLEKKPPKTILVELNKLKSFLPEEKENK
jgi:hypothetical protein